MKKILFLALMSMFAISGIAQEKGLGKPDKAKIEEARVDFFNTNLQLSEKEQADFWPAYNNYSAGMETLRDGKRKPRIDLMTDAEAQAHVDNYFVSEEKKLALRKELYQSIKGKMNVRKLAALPQAEKNFKRQLLKRVRHRQEGGGGGKGKRF